MAELEKLELGAAVGGAYRALIENLGTLFAFLVAWFVLGMAAALAMFSLNSTLRPILYGLGTVDAESMDRVMNLVTFLPLVLVVIAATISLVVAWHRMVVLQHPVRSPFPVGPLDMLRYAWRLFVIFSPLVLIGVMLAGAVYAVLPEAEAERKSLSGYLALPVAVIVVSAVLLFGRLCIALPATAVGDRTMSLWQAWQVTKGNSWRIFWGTVFCTAPFNAVGKLLERTNASIDEDSAQFIVVWILGVIIEMMSYAVLAGFYSHAYLHFTQGDGEDRGPAAHFS